MTNTPLTVSIIVHGDFSHVKPALQSLYATTITPCRVYVVINTGPAPQVEDLRRTFPQVRSIVNATPLSFAANHNRVMQQAETDYVALLNDDIILHENALDILVNYLDTHPEAGLVGPQLRNPDGTNQVSTYSDPSLPRMIYKISGLAVLTRQGGLLRRWLLRIGIGKVLKIESLVSPDTVRPVPVIKGAAMVVRRAAYEQVGLMDETTRAYGEEMDWHLRMRQAGWQVVFVPQARVTHYGSGQAQLQLQGWQLIEDRKAILNYYLKHRPRWEVLVVRCTIVLSHSIGGLCWLLFARDRARVHLQTMQLGIGWQREKPSRR